MSLPRSNSWAHYHSIVTNTSPGRNKIQIFSNNCSNNLSMIQLFLYSNKYFLVQISREQISRLLYITFSLLISHFPNPKPHTASSLSYRGVFIQISIDMRLVFVVVALARELFFKVTVSIFLHKPKKYQLGLSTQPLFFFSFYVFI